MGDGRAIYPGSVAGIASVSPADELTSCVDSAGSQQLDRLCRASVLVVAAEPRLRLFLASSLTTRFALVESAGDTVTAEALLARCHFDLLISAIRLPEMSAPEWVNELRRRGASTDVLYVASDRDGDEAIRAVSEAGSCLIREPFGAEQLLVAVRRCRRRRLAPNTKSHRPLRTPQSRAGHFIIGDCPEIRELCATIERVAPTRSTLLVQGETGTGKEIAARAIHAASGRSGHFVAINCGALPNDLLESELFGHAKGAFTGAYHAREGLIKSAHGGTLFLDEISEMPVQMQAKLLRVLEDRTIRPVGTNEETSADIRIIAATHHELDQDVAAGLFREDLFYRLSVLVMHLPTLRQRLKDVPLLARYFLDTLAVEMGLPVPTYPDAELELLCSHHWPGNVRELRNVIERSLLLDRPPSTCIRVTRSSVSNLPLDLSADLRLATMEQRHIQFVLQSVEGNKSKAARRLGISRKTLDRKQKAWASRGGTMGFKRGTSGVGQERT